MSRSPVLLARTVMVLLAALCGGILAGCGGSSATPGSVTAGVPYASSSGGTVPTTPVLVVPRFNGGSVALPQYADAFLIERGFPPDRMTLGATYTALLDALDRRGCGLGTTLFPATYDWRMPDAPPQVTLDGRVRGLLAHWNDPTAADRFDYAVDYLRYWLIQAVNSNPGAPRVHVIAHSTGVSLVRAYLQSDAYGQVVLSRQGTPVRLPTIDRLILAAPPMEGAPFVWNLWNGNFLSFQGASFGPAIFAGYARAYQHVLSGGVITGPTGDITLGSIAHADSLQQQVNFVRLYNPLIRMLLPTWDFLLSEPPGNINGDPASANRLLLDLNADSRPGDNPWAALAGRVMTTYPVDQSPGATPVYTTIGDEERTGTGGEVLSFTEFANATQTPVPTQPGQTWYHEVPVANMGDGAFPLRTMQRLFFDGSGQPDPRVQVRQWGNRVPSSSIPMDTWTQVDGDLTHNVFITHPNVVDWLVQAATGQ